MNILEDISLKLETLKCHLEKSVIYDKIMADPKIKDSQLYEYLIENYSPMPTDSAKSVNIYANRHIKPSDKTTVQNKNCIEIKIKGLAYYILSESTSNPREIFTDKMKFCGYLDKNKINLLEDNTAVEYSLKTTTTELGKIVLDNYRAI
jgi:hypothetical protein